MKKDKACWGDIPLNHITERHLDSLVADMIRSGLKIPTANKNYRHVQSCSQEGCGVELPQEPTFASHLAMKGKSLQAIQELMRHKSYELTRVYAHSLPLHLLPVFPRLSFLFLVMLAIFSLHFLLVFSGFLPLFHPVFPGFLAVFLFSCHSLCFPFLLSQFLANAGKVVSIKKNRIAEDLQPQVQAPKFQNVFLS